MNTDEAMNNPSLDDYSLQVVPAAGFDLRVWSRGAGDTVVVLPGAGGPVATPALALLAERFRVVIVELPGFGDQPNPASDFDALADQTVLILDALELSTTHVLGTSFGGALALHLAMRHPSRVASMILEAPGGLRAGSVHPATLSPSQLVAAFRHHPERTPVFIPGPPPGSAARWELINRLMGDGLLSDTLADRMRACSVRTLVLWGEHDGVIQPQNAPTYRRLLRNSSLQYVYDAAHDIQCDRPEAFADVVGDFVERGMVFLVDRTDGLINP